MDMGLIKIQTSAGGRLELSTKYTQDHLWILMVMAWETSLVITLTLNQHSHDFKLRIKNKYLTCMGPMMKCSPAKYCKPTNIRMLLFSQFLHLLKFAKFNIR